MTVDAGTMVFMEVTQIVGIHDTHNSLVFSREIDLYYKGLK